jgi:hypothetical protein
MCESKLTYERRKPERTLLYQTIAEHWETFKAEREMEGRTVPKAMCKNTSQSRSGGGKVRETENLGLFCALRPPRAF